MLKKYNLNFSLNVLRKLCGHFIVVLYKGFKAINCCLVHQNNYLRRWFGHSFFLFFNWAFVSYQVWKSWFIWQWWVFMATCRLSLVSVRRGYSLVAASRGYSLVSVHAGFSLKCLLWLQSTALGHKGFSSCGSWALKHRLSGWDAQDRLLCSMWDLPGPGIELMFLALKGGFFQGPLHWTTSEALPSSFLNPLL